MFAGHHVPPISAWYGWSVRPEHLDVLIIGAGISGIAAGYYLQARCPTKSWAILERRRGIGGTWDLFRYPGIRSDSDMYTYGYAFRPWRSPKVVSEGSEIRRYLEETAREYGIDRNIRFGIAVTSARWSSREQQWTIEGVREATGDSVTLTCGFVVSCTGYYDYDRGHLPSLPGRERFVGDIIHPQHWPRGYDYTGKRVVVIGSGATAITLVPAMATTASHVTMLQRSPTYIAAVPRIDGISQRLLRHLPESVVYQLGRMRNIAVQLGTYHLSKAAPGLVRHLVLRHVRGQVGEAADLRHFTPSYAPWDERPCFVPDGDLFVALRSGRASIVTDTIETLTEKGIRLRSGAELAADLIVTATGLELKLLGGIDLTVDDRPFTVGDAYSYKATLFEGLPNFAMVYGYPNQSWTLKVELAARYLCRLLQYMERHAYAQCTPRRRDPRRASVPFVDLRSGYIRRGEHLLPKFGRRSPWRVLNNYILDRFMLQARPIDDGALVFERRKRRSPSS